MPGEVRGEFKSVEGGHGEGAGKETLKTREMIPLRKCPDSKEKDYKFIS